MGDSLNTTGTVTNSNSNQSESIPVADEPTGEPLVNPPVDILEPMDTEDPINDLLDSNELALMQIEESIEAMTLVKSFVFGTSFPNSSDK